MRGICVLSSLLCFMLPGALRADTMYSLSGTYGSYSVSISFDTSLTGSALDGLTSHNITPTVSDFSETNTIPGNGSASLNVTISTDSLGNITTFSITDTSDQVVTSTEDSGETAGTPATPETFSPPAADDTGLTLIDSFSLTGLVSGIYLDGGLCTYNTGSFEGGELLDDEDDGNCPTRAVEHPGSPATPGTPVTAAGTGTFTSNPLNPGAPAAVPEINSGTLLGTLVGLMALAARRRPRSDSRKAPVGGLAIPGATPARPSL